MSGIGKAIAYRFAKENLEIDFDFTQIGQIKGNKKILKNNEILNEAIDVRNNKSICNFLDNIPEYVNVDSIEIMPVDQAWGAFNINRKTY